MVDKEEFLDFSEELESSLVQATKIQKGELKKEKARDFLNKL
jgi:hypothetical protein